MSRAFTNLGNTAITLRQYERARQYLNEGISYCTERDLDSWRLYMTGARARGRFELGNWTGASDDAAEVLACHRVSLVSRIPALVVLAWVRL